MCDPPKDTRVAAYRRCGTEGQEHSIQVQKATVRKERKRRGRMLAAEFENEGKRGIGTASRIGLRNFLVDTTNDRCGLVAMYNVSRVEQSGVHFVEEKKS